MKNIRAVAAIAAVAIFAAITATPAHAKPGRSCATQAVQHGLVGKESKSFIRFCNKKNAGARSASTKKNTHATRAHKAHSRTAKTHRIYVPVTTGAPSYKYYTTSQPIISTHCMQHARSLGSTDPTEYSAVSIGLRCMGQRGLGW